MSNQLGESLSALMDGEASERDIELVLDNLDQESVRDTWRRFNNARHGLGPGAGEAVTGIDLSAGIMSALADEPAPELAADVDSTPVTIQPVGRWHRFSRPVASLAVAASVCAAVLLGTQFYGVPVEDNLPAVERISSGGVVNPLSGAAVRTGADFTTPAVEPAQQSSDYDAIARDRLQRYLLPHTEEAALNGPRGMMPFARVATFETEE